MLGIPGECEGVIAMTLTIFDPCSGKPVRIEIPDERDSERAMRQTRSELDRAAENRRKAQLTVVALLRPGS
jgi:hypothetical protein